MERQAEIIIAHARKRQAKIDSQNAIEHRVKFLKDTPKTVIRMLRRGHSLEEALKETSKICDVPIVTISKHWDNFLKEKNQKSVAERNKLLKDLHALGLSNVTIAKRLDLHPVSVSRILSKNKKGKSKDYSPSIGSIFKTEV